MNTAETTRESAFEIRFGQVGLAQVRVLSIDAKAVQDQLAARLASAPQLFDRTAVCLDLGALEKEPEVAQVRSLLDAIRRAGMCPVGLAHGTATVEAIARTLDLPVLTQFRVQAKLGHLASPPREPTKPAAPAPAPEPPQPQSEIFSSPTLMHHHPVRSGQRVYAKHRDLVVTSVVGNGAEVIADGCVHIYGALRGKAIAGARGEVTARVFALEFQAELVSIAGVFRVFETIPTELAGKPVQAWLDGDDLRFARIGA